MDWNILQKFRLICLELRGLKSIGAGLKDGDSDSLVLAPKIKGRPQVVSLLKEEDIVGEPA